MFNPEVQQLRDTINRLEARLRNLEEVIDVIGGRISLKAGSSSITISPNSVVIKSNDIEITGSGKVTVKASGNLIMKGSKILQN